MARRLRRRIPRPRAAHVDRLLLKPVDARALVEALLALHTREAAAAQVGAA
jgi:hypothetical protein